MLKAFTSARESQRERRKVRSRRFTASSSLQVLSSWYLTAVSVVFVLAARSGPSRTTATALAFLHHGAPSSPQRLHRAADIAAAVSSCFECPREARNGVAVGSRASSRRCHGRGAFAGIGTVTIRMSAAAEGPGLGGASGARSGIRRPPSLPQVGHHVADIAWRTLMLCIADTGYGIGPGFNLRGVGVGHIAHFLTPHREEVKMLTVSRLVWVLRRGWSSPRGVAVLYLHRVACIWPSQVERHPCPIFSHCTVTPPVVQAGLLSAFG